MKYKFSSFQPAGKNPGWMQLYLEFFQLKNLFRQGWLKRGLSETQCESVADHTLGVLMLSMFIRDRYYDELDAEKVFRMALLHDFGEIFTGDIIPADRVESSEKHRLEKNSVEKVFSNLPDGESYLKIWLEFEACETPEAVFVRQIDKLEMVMQARTYQGLTDLDLSEFFDSAAAAISWDEIIEIMKQVSQN